MKFTTNLRANILFALALSTLFAMNTPAMATSAPTTTITSSGDVLSTVNGNYGAHVNSMTNGATITTDMTHANVNIYGNGSTLTWQTLNTAPNQSLNFNFSANGQVALNNVVGDSMSRFAGSLTSSGAAGRVIISNHNGILFENGSYTNVNALILTTKDVMWDGNLYGQINLYMNKSTAGITIGQGDTSKMAVMRIAEDLNIVAPKIVINAADIKTGVNASGNLLNNGKGDLRLITADGVTFYAADAVAPGADKFAYTGAANDNNYGDITIQKASIAVADNTTNKVYLIAKRDITIKDGSSLRNAIIKTGHNVNTNSASIANTNINAGGLLNLMNGSTLINSSVTTANGANIFASQVSNSNIYSEGNNIYLYNGSTINNSTINAAKWNIYINNGSNINSSQLLAGASIIGDNAIINNSVLNAKGNINIYNNSQINNSSVYALSLVHLSSTSINNATITAGNTIYTYQGTSIKNVSLNAQYDINIAGTKISESQIKTGHNINISSDSDISNCYLSTGNTVNMNSSKLSNSSINASKNVNIINKSIINSSYASAGDDATVKDSTINNSVIYANDIATKINTTVINSFIYSGHK